EVLTDAAVLIDGERIAAVGRYTDLQPGTGNVERGVEGVEGAGVVYPGFIDCHTHAVFGAPRLDDHERRALGMDYKTIAAAGGGILESVRDVRARSDVELATLTRARLAVLLTHGATTIEVKSGYGLDCETELRQLRVIARPAGGPPPRSGPQAARRRARRFGRRGARRGSRRAERGSSCGRLPSRDPRARRE